MNHNKNIRVIHVLYNISFSGAEVMLKDAANLFIENGIELYALNAHEIKGEYAGILQNAGYKIIQLPYQKTFSSGIKLIKILKKEKIDVVHIHREGGFLWFALIARLAGIKNVVRQIHSLFDFKSQKRVRFNKFFQRIAARLLLDVSFVAIGDSVAKNERDIYKYEPKIIRNWIDKNKFYPLKNASEKGKIRIKYGLPLNSILLISVGSCIKIKNHDSILEAVKLLKNRSKKDVHYVHLGDGELHVQEQKSAEKLGIKSNVSFLGQVTNVRDLLVASDIYVMPSQYEGLPISLLEAMSCGLPSVANNVSGIKDLITNDVNGLLVEGNTSDLFNGILVLTENSTKRHRMGLRAIEKIKEEYDINRSVMQLINLYKSKIMSL